jgi:hypothetical protein
MESREDGLKIVHSEIHNFKNIECSIVDVNGMSLIVMGRNGAGKSSFIQALTSPMDTKTVPSEPLRKGKKDDEVSSIETVIAGTMGGQPKKYTLTMYFTPGNKKGRLVVTNDAGEVIKQPATFVKSLIGNVSFDPTKWLNESADKQLKMLKQLTGCEDKIDKINDLLKDKKSQRKAKKERAEELEAVLKNHGYTQEQIDLYSNPKDIKPIQEELANISKAIEKYSGIKNQMAGFEKSIKDCDADIAKRRDNIEKLKQLIIEEEKAIESQFAVIEKNKKNIITGNKWFSENHEPSASEINERLNKANDHNVHYFIISKHAEQQREMLKAKEALQAIDNEVDKLEKERGDLISSSQLPINGLSFTEDQIMIDGFPMELGQINTARLWDIAVDVAIAMKPTLKVIMLHEASLFDKQSLRTIIKKIEEKGFMAIAEYVDPNGGDLEIKFAEEELK